MKLSELKLNPKNPQKYKDLSKLQKSIKEFPKMMELRPMIYDPETRFVLGGNKRLICLQKLGFEDIPDSWVRSASELTEEEKKRFIIADNVGFGEWDFEILKDEYSMELLEDWGMEISKELSEIPEASEDDFEIPDEIKTDIVFGDLLEIGEHKLLCGDSTETDMWKRIMGNELADLVVTDPPYNVDYTGKTKKKLKIDNDKKTDDEFYQFLYDFYSALNSFVKPGGIWYIFHAIMKADYFMKAMKDAGIMLKQYLIWVKDKMVIGRQDYQWKHEGCLYGWKEGATYKWYSDRKQTTILEFDRPKKNEEHPTMKPIPLIGYLIKNSSKNGDLICDAFLGSGTTMVASHHSNVDVME